MSKLKKVVECQHPSNRLHSWFATDGTLCVCCNDCGAVLAGEAKSTGK